MNDTSTSNAGRKANIYAFSVYAIVIILLATSATVAVAQSTPGYIYTAASMGTGVGAMTHDPSGNIYWCAGSNQVFKLTPVGAVSVFAGNGAASSTGDGGPATAASVNGCTGLASDAGGNIYIADFYSFKVRIVNTSGIISTFAGSGSDVYGGDGGPATAAGMGHTLGIGTRNGNVYISDTDNSVIRVVNSQGIISVLVGVPTMCGDNGDGGPASGAQICSPTGIDFDASGNMYFMSSTGVYPNGTGVVRKISTSGKISTYAGVGAGLGNVQDIKFDPFGTLYLAQYYPNSFVFSVSTSGTISTFAGTGSVGYNGDNIPALQANLSDPVGLAVDNSGNVFIGEDLTGRVREVIANRPFNPCTAVAGTICTVAGNVNNLSAGFSGDGGPAFGAALNNPLGLFVDGSNNIFVADSYNNRVRKFTVGGTIQTIAGNGNGGGGVYDNGDGGQATQATTNTPVAVSEDGSGNLAILDQFANGNEFPNGNSDTYSAIREVSLSTGQISLVLGTSINVGSFVADGFFITDIAFGTNTSSSVGVDGPGFYTGGYGLDFISSLSSQIGASTQIASFNSVNVATNLLAVDSGGNVYFSSAPLPLYESGRGEVSYTILMMDTSGNIKAIVGNGSPSYSSSDEGGPATSAGITPGAFAIDSAGNLFIVDLSVSTVRVVPAGSQNIYTIAGDPTQTPGFSGDGGQATSAQLNNPGGIKVDAAGNLYISDTSNNLIRMVTNASSIAAGFVEAGGGPIMPGSGCTPTPRRPCAQ